MSPTFLSNFERKQWKKAIFEQQTQIDDLASIIRFLHRHPFRYVSRKIKAKLKSRIEARLKSRG